MPTQRTLGAVIYTVASTAIPNYATSEHGLLVVRAGVDVTKRDWNLSRLECTGTPGWTPETAWLPQAQPQVTLGHQTRSSPWAQTDAVLNSPATPSSKCTGKGSNFCHVLHHITTTHVSRFELFVYEEKKGREENSQQLILILFKSTRRPERARRARRVGCTDTPGVTPSMYSPECCPQRSSTLRIARYAPRPSNKVQRERLLVSYQNPACRAGETARRVGCLLCTQWFYLRHPMWPPEHCQSNFRVLSQE